MPLHSSARRYRLPRAEFVLPLAASLLGGCANPGPPRPPSLHLPAPVKDLRAERTGDEVVLSWTMPTRTTDGAPLRGTTSASICREVVHRPPSRPATSVPGGAPELPAACSSVAHLTPAPGGARYVDRLPAALIAGPPQLLAYRVDLANPAGHSAGASPAAFTATGEAPAAMGALQSASTRQGAVLTWTARPSAASVELMRSPVTAPASNAAPVILRATPASASQAVAGGRPDAGGLLDPTVREPGLAGMTFQYVAQRVLRLTLSGHPVELRGLPSPPAMLAWRDTFPPRAPAGLAAVPSQAGEGSAHAMDLAWEPSEDDDLLGYNVYRSETGAGAQATFQRLNPQPLPTSSFRDLTVQPGHLYTYRVTAIDRNHNEGPPSAVVSQAIPR